MPQTMSSCIKRCFGIGSWNAVRNRSIYPVNRYGFNNSKNSMGINATAVPMKTIEIVTIIGVTLFFENVLIIKQRAVTVNIKIFDSQKLKPNRQNVSDASKTNSPS